MALIVFVLNDAADGVEHLVHCSRGNRVAFLSDDVAATGHRQIDFDGERAQTLMAFLGDRDLAFADRRVKAL